MFISSLNISTLMKFFEIYIYTYSLNESPYNIGVTDPFGYFISGKDLPQDGFFTCVSGKKYAFFNELRKGCTFNSEEGLMRAIFDILDKNPIVQVSNRTKTELKVPDALSELVKDANLSLDYRFIKDKYSDPLILYYAK